MNNITQVMQAISQLKNNPMSILGKLNVPQNIMNDPNAIIQNLMNSGKITQEQYNNAVKQAQAMGFKQ